LSIRLNKLLASRGIGARRKCDAMIQAGLVRVNGEVVTEPGRAIEPQRDRVEVEGRPLPGAAPLRYYMLHKPVGVISTLSDPEGRRSLRDLMPPGPRLFSVGRLDADTSGLLLLTNDGELAHHLMHPRYGVTKRYRAHVDRAPTEQQIERLQNGVEFEPGVVSSPAQVWLRDSDSDEAVIELALHEGRQRQVRKMCEALGLEVRRLHRYGYGPLKLGDLSRGMWRELSEAEVESLRSASARPRGRGASAPGYTGRRSFDRPRGGDRPRRSETPRPRPQTSERPRRDYVPRPRPQTSERPRREYAVRPGRESVERPRRDFVPRPRPQTSERPRRDYVPRPRPQTSERPRRGFGARAPGEYPRRPAPRGRSRPTGRPFRAEGSAGRGDAPRPNRFGPPRERSFQRPGGRRDAPRPNRFGPPRERSFQRPGGRKGAPRPNQFGPPRERSFQRPGGRRDAPPANRSGPPRERSFQRPGSRFGDERRTDRSVARPEGRPPRSRDRADRFGANPPRTGRAGAPRRGEARGRRGAARGRGDETPFGIFRRRRPKS
jgi:23S rRNA pseudouridine2605 synthase